MNKSKVRGTCPSCKRAWDSHATAGQDEGVPVRPGDTAVCMGCGEVLTVQQDGTMRRCTQDEFCALEQRTQRAIRRAVVEIKEHARRN